MLGLDPNELLEWIKRISGAILRSDTTKHVIKQETIHAIELFVQALEMFDVGLDMTNPKEYYIVLTFKPMETYRVMLTAICKCAMLPRKVTNTPTHTVFKMGLNVRDNKTMRLFPFYFEKECKYIKASKKSIAGVLLGERMGDHERFADLISRYNECIEVQRWSERTFSDILEPKYLSYKYREYLGRDDIDYVDGKIDEIKSKRWDVTEERI